MRRSMRSSRIGRPEVVPWVDLHRQFGSDYADLRVFKFKVLKRVIEEVQDAGYPNVNFLVLPTAPP